MRERDFHPEWGYLASTSSLARTLRSLSMAAAVGAVVGSGMVLWLIHPAPNDSIAARTLVPSGPEVTAKPPEVTSAKVPSLEQRQLPPSATTIQAKAETVDASAEPESPGSSKINPNPSLVQRHIGSTGEHEPTSSRSVKAVTPPAEGAQRRETNRNSPHRGNHTNAALAASESTAEPEPVRSKPPTREFIARGSNPKDARNNNDLSAFFQPWWYAEPARERRRNPG
jgi:hypothetical protein